MVKFNCLSIFLNNFVTIKLSSIITCTTHHQNINNKIADYLNNSHFLLNDTLRTGIYNDIIRMLTKMMMMIIYGRK